MIRSRLERERPEKLGISPSAILKFLRAMDETGFTAHDIILIKSGKVAFEIYYNPFKPGIKHYLCSCSKSVTSAAVGFALSEELFSLDDRVVDIFPDKLVSPPHPFIAATTIRHLLTMTTAYDEALEPATDDWTREFLNGKPGRYPGTVFVYDSIGTHVLCETVQRRSGTTVQKYLTPRLFEPLGIAEEEIFWTMNPGGVNHGGGGLELTPEAMAKFGLLFLNCGKFNGRQILPEGWAEQATANLVSCPTCDGTFKEGYGYKFWRVRENGFACLGLAGQAIVMHPDKDFVFVGTANGFQTDYHYFHMMFMWEHLYNTISEGPVPFEEEAYAELLGYAENAEAFLPRGAASSKLASQYGGKYLSAEENKAGVKGFSFSFGEALGEFTLDFGAREIKIPFGYKKHARGGAELQDFARQQGDAYPNGSGSAGVWTDEGTLVIKSHVTDTLQYFLITCRFAEKAVVCEIKPYGIYSYEKFPCALNHIK